MFTLQTESALSANMGAEAGQPWPVTLSAEVYRELVFAARQWGSLRSGPSMRSGASIRLVPQVDGSMEIQP